MKRPKEGDLILFGGGTISINGAVLPVNIGIKSDRLQTVDVYTGYYVRVRGENGRWRRWRQVNG